MSIIKSIRSGTLKIMETIYEHSVAETAGRMWQGREGHLEPSAIGSSTTVDREGPRAEGPDISTGGSAKMLSPRSPYSDWEDVRVLKHSKSINDLHSQYEEDANQDRIDEHQEAYWDQKRAESCSSPNRSPKHRGPKYISCPTHGILPYPHTEALHKHCPEHPSMLGMWMYTAEDLEREEREERDWESAWDTDDESDMDEDEAGVMRQAIGYVARRLKRDATDTHTADAGFEQEKKVKVGEEGERGVEKAIEDEDGDEVPTPKKWKGKGKWQPSDPVPAWMEWVDSPSKLPFNEYVYWHRPDALGELEMVRDGVVMSEGPPGQSSSSSSSSSSDKDEESDDEDDKERQRQMWTTIEILREMEKSITHGSAETAEEHQVEHRMEELVEEPDVEKADKMERQESGPEFKEADQMVAEADVGRRDSVMSISEMKVDPERLLPRNLDQHDEDPFCLR